MSLVDRALKAKAAMDRQKTVPLSGNKVEWGEKDEFGIVARDTIDYLVARILYIDAHFEEERLHMRNQDTEVWKGHTRLAKSKRTLYLLCHWQQPLADYQVELIWNRLIQLLPYLDESKYAVSEHEYFDRETGELVHTDEPLLTIN